MAIGIKVSSTLKIAVAPVTFEEGFSEKDVSSVVAVALMLTTTLSRIILSPSNRLPENSMLRAMSFAASPVEEQTVLTIEAFLGSGLVGVA